jgi:hypothetical protein
MIRLNVLSLGNKIVKKISTNIKPATFFSLYNESDRGCVLLLGEILSTLLEQIIDAAVVANLTGEDFPEKFFKEKLSSRPFRTFDNRVTGAYSFKLINSDQYKILQAIRELRNEVAHGVFDFSLNNEGVVEHLKLLEAYKAKINMAKLMKFETFVPSVDEKNMKRFELVVTGYEIYVELSNILGDQLERILAKRAQIKQKEDEKKSLKIPSGEFSIDDLEKANSDYIKIALRVRLSAAIENGEIKKIEGAKPFRFRGA